MINFIDVNEELQSTVEELETTNEELQSTNEELETMNEELQSTNEELQTMNEEMRQSSDELNRVNSFLESVVGCWFLSANTINCLLLYSLPAPDCYLYETSFLSALCALCGFFNR